MLLNNRVIFSNNGTLSDVSIQVSDYNTGMSTIDIVAAQDALYIGSDQPFNHRYFKMGVPNDQDSVVSVSLWNGSSWVAAVDVVDQTSGSGNSMALSGILSWVPDRNQAWVKEDTSENVTGISTLKIYNMYWAKLTWSANFKATTSMKYIGHKFSRDEELFVYYPDLSEVNVMNAFQPGKANWDRQHIAAAEEIVKKLRKKDIVWSDNQILDWEQFSVAGVHKTAAIIFSAFGDDYKDNLADALKNYEIGFNMNIYNVDLDKDGRLDKFEKQIFPGIIRR